MQNLVNINLHGVLGESVGFQNWDVVANSLGECFRFIEMNSKKFYKTLYDFDKKNIRYEVIINGRAFKPERELTLDNIKDVYESELMMKYDDLKTVDIVPVLEGANSDIAQTILGVILIIVGVIFITTFGSVLIVAGLALLASGVVGLLTKPPKFEDFREIESGGKTSYLFSGPANVIGEGGPVPVGYGRLIVGSQVVSAAYVVRDFSTADPTLVLRDEYGGLIPRLR
jgi:predicted phage tail protein